MPVESRMSFVVRKARVHCLIVAGLLVIALSGCGGDDITSSAQNNGIPLGTPYFYGKYSQGAIVGGGWSPDFLQGVPITVTRATHLNRLGYILGSFSGSPAQSRMALYKDNAGVPGALVAGSAPRQMILGRNEFAIYPTPIPAGNYWLFFSFSATANLYNDGGSQTRTYLAYPFGNAWPNPFPVPGGQTTTPIWSIYMMVTD